jgi:FkbM family methyltransferase
MWEASTIELGDFMLHVDRRDRNIVKKLALYGDYENHVQRLLVSLATPGSVVIDVGANIGLHTLPLARRVGTTGQIIAFEPDPNNYQLLLRNIRANGLTNISVHRLALSCESGTALLYQSWKNRGGLSLREENVDRDGPPIAPVAVETIAGDTLLASLERPISLIKIDVEGAEPLVLQGLSATLRHQPQAKLVFEFWPRFLRSFRVDSLEFLGQLEGQGFCLSVVDSEVQRLIPAGAREIVEWGETAESALNLLAIRGVRPEA